MKTLKFAENLVPMVISGEKTSTWRLFDDKDLKIGDKLSLIDRGTGKEFATAKIVFLKEKTLGEMGGSDFDRHENYENKEKMLETYKSYYGDKVTKDTVVKMIDFKILQIKK